MFKLIQFDKLLQGEILKLNNSRSQWSKQSKITSSMIRMQSTWSSTYHLERCQLGSHPQLIWWWLQIKKMWGIKKTTGIKLSKDRVIRELQVWSQIILKQRICKWVNKKSEEVAMKLEEKGRVFQKIKISGKNYRMNREDLLLRIQMNYPKGWLKHTKNLVIARKLKVMLKKILSIRLE